MSYLALLDNFNAVIIGPSDGCGEYGPWYPLYHASQSYLNPCFVNICWLTCLALCAPFLLKLLLLPRHSRGYGLLWDVRNVGMSHYLRFASALAYSALCLVLVDSSMKLSNMGVKVSAVVALFLAAPLHLIETIHSPKALSGLILFWLQSSIVLFCIVVLDSVSPYKILLSANSTHARAISQSAELSIMLVSFVSFCLELFFFSPSAELKRDYIIRGQNLATERNLIESITFNWVEPTLAYVKKHGNLKVEQVPETTIDLKSGTTGTLFLQEWKRQMSKSKMSDGQKSPSIFFAMLRLHYPALLKTFTLELVDITCITTAPFLLQGFINFVYDISEDSKTTQKPPAIVGVSLTVGIFICSLIRFIAFNQYFTINMNMSFKIRSAVTCAIYEKALRISPEARRDKSTGDIVNHVSVDVMNIGSCIELCADIIILPLRLSSCLFALYTLLGPSMWAGLAAALVLVPLSSLVTKSLMSLFNATMKIKDERTRLMSEILSSIKSIKLYSWERSMLDRLHTIRNEKELVKIRQMGIFNAGSSFLWTSIPFVISCVVYSLYAAVFKRDVVPNVVFPALSLFNLLTEPINLLPNMISEIVEAKIALRRITEFLIMADLEEDAIKRTSKTLAAGDVAVSVKNATMVWSAEKSKQRKLEDSDIALSVPEFEARKGQLTCIVGKVGSGKTTFLRSLIGEISMASVPGASIAVNGLIAHCSQSPCILNTSIRENILFGRKYDPGFYRKVVEACQLSIDFQVLPKGDATLVGEKGISLSGGQKARVSLARALYFRSDIVLLDDVLSAVDAHVAKKITKEVLSASGLMATKTLILTTNSMSVLNIAHEIVLLEKGTIAERGTYGDLMSDPSSSVFKLVAEFAKHYEEEEEEEEEGLPAEQAELVTPPEVSLSSDSEDLNRAKPFNTAAVPELEEVMDLTLKRVMTSNTIGGASMMSFGKEYQFEDDFKRKAGSQDVEEQKAKGNIAWSVYYEFFKACNWLYILMWCMFFWAVVGLNILGNWILKYWSELNLIEGRNVDTTFFLLSYASTGILGGFLTFVSSYVIWTYSSVKSSRYFHDKMANSVLRSPMSFFDTTPVGRILNRFSDDIAMLDQQVLWCITTFFAFVLESFTRLSVVVINLPFMIIVIGVMFFIYNYVRKKFMPGSRELKRLSSTARSPIFSHVQESITGVETIRAYGEQKRFIHEIRVKVDNLTKIQQTVQGANRWLSMRLQGIAALIVLASSLLILLSIYRGRGFSPSMVGFIMSYVFSSTSTLNAIIRLWAEVETQAVGLERLIEYGNLPSEAELVIEDNRPPEQWPEHGGIEFNNYSTRYRAELDPVLIDISLKIRPGEKVGIVGRTGAGKSSLTLALFRLIEPYGGNITIDLINTSEIGLFDLRGKLNIIPQDVAAFEGTVRENLDPFQGYSDDRLWEVLELAHLKDHVEAMKTELKADKNNTRNTGQSGLEPTTSETQVGLSAKISEGGSNLSAGQKQLMCLARALLKKSQVLVLDEATAAVDVQTDKIIQETIRAEFKEKTILTIAHRLDTIMDSDRVLVLDKGRVKEFDSPASLLADTSSEFYSLCKEGGYVKT